MKEAGVIQLCDSVIVSHSCVPVRHVGDYVRAGDMGAIMGKQRERTGDKNQAITWQGKAITWKGKEISWSGKAITWLVECQPGLLKLSFALDRSKFTLEENLCHVCIFWLTVSN